MKMCCEDIDSFQINSNLMGIYYNNRLYLIEHLLNAYHTENGHLILRTNLLL